MCVCVYILFDSVYLKHASHGVQHLSKKIRLGNIHRTHTTPDHTTYTTYAFDLAQSILRRPRPKFVDFCVINNKLYRF